MGLFDPNVGKMENKRDVKGLVKALKHKNNAIRKESKEALRRIGDERCKNHIRRLDEIERELKAELDKAARFIDIHGGIRYADWKRQESEAKRLRVLKDIEQVVNSCRSS